MCKQYFSQAIGAMSLNSDDSDSRDHNKQPKWCIVYVKSDSTVSLEPLDFVNGKFLIFETYNTLTLHRRSTMPSNHERQNFATVGIKATDTGTCLLQYDNTYQSTRNLRFDFGIQSNIQAYGLEALEGSS